MQHMRTRLSLRKIDRRLVIEVGFYWNKRFARVFGTSKLELFSKVSFVFQCISTFTTKIPLVWSEWQTLLIRRGEKLRQLRKPLQNWSSFWRSSERNKSSFPLVSLEFVARFLAKNLATNLNCHAVESSIQWAAATGNSGEFRWFYVWGNEIQLKCIKPTAQSYRYGEREKWE